jgi:parvulin-like peptidyl-prolyl isomerase
MMPCGRSSLKGAPGLPARTRAGLWIAFCICAFAALSARGSRGALFEDPIVAKAKGFQIHESDLQEAYVGYKAAAAAMGQRTPPALEQDLKRQILDKLIATRLLLARATAQDKDDGKQLAEKLIKETRSKASSDSAYRRRLLAVGSNPEKYEAEIQEQAIVQIVIDRELKNKDIISEAEIKKFYDEKPELFTEPEKARVAHILIATRKIPSGEPLPIQERLAKKMKAEQVLARARAGEDFTKLVTEFSEDTESKGRKGEIAFQRHSGVVPPEFESAAFSLEPGQISDLVMTVFGYDIIKLIEKTPPSKVPLEKVHDDIGERLQRGSVQERLPAFVSKLRKEAEVQILPIP